MPELIKWDRPRGSVHNLAHALELKDSGCNLLILSDAALYVLQNYMSLDIEFKARWADQVLENGYIPIADGSPSYGSWVDLIDQIQDEVRDMSCDIVTELQAINTTLSALQAEQSAWDDLWSSLLAGLAGLPTSADITALTAAVGTQDLCCGAAAELPYRPAPPDSTQNPETSDFCDMCWSFARDWADVNYDVLDLWHSGQVLTVGLLAIITALLSVPLAVVFGIMLVIVGVIVETNRDNFVEFAGTLVTDIACSVFCATDAESAKEACLAVIDGATFPDLWPPAATLVLKYLISQDALNQVFTETYAVRPDSVGSDCGDCPCAGCVFGETAHAAPYNVIIEGDNITALSNDAANGWRGVAGVQQIRFYLNPAPAYYNPWKVTCQTKIVQAGGPYTIGLEVWRWITDSWVTVAYDTAMFAGDSAFHTVQFDFTYPIFAGSLYRLDFGNDAPGYDHWVRDITAECVE